jgi:hypothetical protein
LGIRKLSYYEDLQQRSVQKPTKNRYILQIYRQQVSSEIWKLSYLCTLKENMPTQFHRRFEGRDWKLYLEYTNRGNAMSAKQAIRKMLKEYSDKIDPEEEDRKLYRDCIYELDLPVFGHIPRLRLRLRHTHRCSAALW